MDYEREVNNTEKNGVGRENRYKIDIYIEWKSTTTKNWKLEEKKGHKIRVWLVFETLFHFVDFFFLTSHLAHINIVSIDTKKKRIVRAVPNNEEK